MFLNSKMDEYLTQMVAGHEMGHDIYHRELAREKVYKNLSFSCMQSTTEYEANAFAAILLLIQMSVWNWLETDMTSFKCHR